MESPASAGRRSNVDDIHLRQRADRRQFDGLPKPSRCHPTNSTLSSEAVGARTAIASEAVVAGTELGSRPRLVRRNGGRRSLDLFRHADDLSLSFGPFGVSSSQDRLWSMLVTVASAPLLTGSDLDTCSRFIGSSRAEDSEKLTERRRIYHLTLYLVLVWLRRRSTDGLAHLETVGHRGPKPTAPARCALLYRLR